MVEIDKSCGVDFSDGELGDLERYSITLRSGKKRDAIQLANSWSAHVKKLDSDRGLPQSDHSVWNEFDLCAAMSIREMLNSAIEQIPDSLAKKVSIYVSGADERFRSMTVADSGKRMAAIAEIDLEGRGWWWFRVPDSGPIVEDLARWSKYDEPA